MLRSLAADPVLGQFAFEPVGPALDAVVARLVPGDQALTLWRAAHAHCAEGFWPILTGDYYAHEDIELVGPIATMSLDEARAAREHVVRSSQDAGNTLDAIPHAVPQAEPYEERDIFLDYADSPTASLVLVKGSMLEALWPFTPDGDGRAPRKTELLAMLRSWNERYGAEALFGDRFHLELDVRSPPRDLPGAW